MQVAFGVFANAKIQCEESVSSSTPQIADDTDYADYADFKIFATRNGSRFAEFHKDLNGSAIVPKWYTKKVDF